MYGIKYTSEDSTKNKPHYTFTFFDKDNQYLGEYSIYGYYLYNVYIVEKFRGKGYCKKIVSHAVKRKKNLILDVDKNNIPAIRCYKSCGFKFVKELKNYHHEIWGKKVSPTDVYRFKT